jgi:hypothetical protein
MMDFAPTTSIQDELSTFFLSSPTPEQIVAFQASEVAQARLRYLLDVNRNGTLTSEERADLDEASYANHFMILLKAKALKTLKA